MDNSEKQICDAYIYIGGSTLLFVISEIMPFINKFKSNGIFHSLYIIFQNYRNNKQELNSIYNDNIIPTSLGGYRSNNGGYVDIFELDP